MYLKDLEIIKKKMKMLTKSKILIHLSCTYAILNFKNIITYILKIGLCMHGVSLLNYSTRVKVSWTVLKSDIFSDGERKTLSREI